MSEEVDGWVWQGGGPMGGRAVRVMGDGWVRMGEEW
jgi:hypothetical protein